MPKRPFVVDGVASENVEVRAMVRGHAGRGLWVDFTSLPWLISFAAGELSGRNLVRPDTHYKRFWTFDQPPYYQNEVGAQNKPTLAVQGATVPILSLIHI